MEINDAVKSDVDSSPKSSAKESIREQAELFTPADADILPNQEYFSTPARQGLVQQISQLAFFGDGLSVIQGVEGSGKTSIFRELEKSLQKAQYLASLHCVVGEKSSDFLFKVAQAFGIPCSQQAAFGELIAELRRFSQSLIHNKKLAILVLDDAHRLSDETAGALISLLQGNDKSGFGLHLIFFAKPGMAERMDKMQLMDVPIYDFEIPNFSPSELGSFLNNFSPGGGVKNETLRQIWAAAQGFPGKALSLAAQALSEGERVAALSLRSIPIGHGIAIAALVVILLWVLLGREPQGPEALVSEDASVENAVAEEESQEVSAQNLDIMQNPEPEQNQAQGSAAQAINVSEESVVAEPGGKLSAQAPTPEVEMATQSAVRQVSEDPEKNGAEATLASSSTSPSVANVSGQVDPKPKQKLSEDEAFLLAQSSDAYCLQVMAVSKQSALDEFISRQANKARLHSYRGKREDKTWYVVVEGVYASREKASEAIKNLPPEQSKAGAWPKSLKSVKQEIEDFRSK